MERNRTTGRIDRHIHEQAEAKKDVPRHPMLRTEQVEQAGSIAVPPLRFAEIARRAVYNQLESGREGPQEDRGTRYGFGPMNRYRTAALTEAIPSHELIPTRASTEPRADILPMQNFNHLTALREFRKMYSQKEDRFGDCFDENWALHYAQFLFACGDYEVREHEMGRFLVVGQKEEALHFFMEVCPTEPEHWDWLCLQRSLEGRHASITRQEEASAIRLRINFR